MTVFKEKHLLLFILFMLKCKHNQGSVQQSTVSQVLCWNENTPFQNRIPSAVGKLLSLWSQGITELLA